MNGPRGAVNSATAVPHAEPEIRPWIPAHWTLSRLRRGHHPMETGLRDFEAMILRRFGKGGVKGAGSHVREEAPPLAEAESGPSVGTPQGGEGTTPVKV
jgi:hypothetical protein